MFLTTIDTIENNKVERKHTKGKYQSVFFETSLHKIIDL